MGKERSKRQEARAKSKQEAQCQELWGGEASKERRTKDKKRPKEKEARWKNVETASPTTILPMRTSEKKGKKNNNQCK
jgi:hypothetical protein